MFAAVQLVSLMTAVPDAIGYDYHYFMPRLLEGLLFFKAQGFITPWYSSFLCGGFPYFPDPQSLFYSLPQFLSFIVDPWTAVQLTAVVFLTLGGLGMFLLTRNCFGFSVLASLISALFFASNSFFVARMVIGHLTFHAYMLIPLLAFFLLEKKISFLTSAISLTLIASYFVHSGAHYISLIAIPSLILIILCYFLVAPMSITIGSLISRASTGIIGGILLSASKLVAAASLVSEHPRHIKLDQLDSYSDGILLIANQLFGLVEFYPFKYGPWEYRTEISPLVLVGIFGAFYHFLCQIFKQNGFKNIEPKQILRTILSLILLLTLSFFLFEFATGTGAWLSQANSIELVRNMRLNMRFSAAFLPPLVILSGFGFSKIQNLRIEIFVLATITLASVVSLEKLRSEAPQYMNFPIAGLNAAYSEMKESEAGSFQPTDIVKEKWTDYKSMLVKKSNARCYSTLFARPPVKKLSEGAILRVNSDSYNMINPSCYLFPEENSCRAGDLIAARDEENLRLLLSHQNPKWKVSRNQKIANVMTPLSLLLLIFLVVARLLSRKSY